MEDIRMVKAREDVLKRYLVSRRAARTPISAMQHVLANVRPDPTSWVVGYQSSVLLKKAAEEYLQSIYERAVAPDEYGAYWYSGKRLIVRQRAAQARGGVL